MSSTSTELLPADADLVRSRTELDPTWWRIAAAWILMVAALLRFYNLELKPLHHDEGVNGFFLINLIRSSTGYRYDPANYHGPTLYYFARASAALFGVSTFAIRFVPALCGTLTVGLVLAWRRQLGAIGAVAAAALLALSPGAVYMSRYFIHESLLVCFTLAALVALTRYFEYQRSRYLVLTGAALGLMFATKETAVISVAVAALAFTAMLVLAGRRLDAAGFLRQTDAISGALRRAIVPFGGALAAFAAIAVLFFSSFFKHPEALPDAVRSFALWARTGTAAHVHPWSSYLSWLLQEEAGILTLGIAGAAIAVYRRDNAFAVFAALWAGGMLVAYSLVPYKTPWLTLNLIAPLAVIGGYAADRMWLAANRGFRIVLVGVALAVCVITLVQSVNLNFIHYDDGRYPYVYVHTQRDLLRLVRDVDRIAESRPAASGRLHITVTSPQQFPLSWYLRNFDVGYYDHVVETNDPIVIGTAQQDGDLASRLGKSHDRTGIYALRPGVRLVMYAHR